jgi:hypothetical protein
MHLTSRAVASAFHFLVATLDQLSAEQIISQATYILICCIIFSCQFEAFLRSDAGRPGVTEISCVHVHGAQHKAVPHDCM